MQFEATVNPCKHLWRPVNGALFGAYRSRNRDQNLLYTEQSVAFIGTSEFTCKTLAEPIVSNIIINNNAITSE